MDTRQNPTEAYREKCNAFRGFIIDKMVAIEHYLTESIVCYLLSKGEISNRAVLIRDFILQKSTFETKVSILRTGLSLTFEYDKSQIDDVCAVILKLNELRNVVAHRYIGTEHTDAYHFMQTKTGSESSTKTSVNRKGEQINQMINVVSPIADRAIVKFDQIEDLKKQLWFADAFLEKCENYFEKKNANEWSEFKLIFDQLPDTLKEVMQDGKSSKGVFSVFPNKKG
jgi:hypothetical protein